MPTDDFSPGKDCWAAPRADFAGVIIDAADYFRAFVRAALKAERTLFIAGWQFDTKTVLLRGEEAKTVRFPLQFLPFLNYLCKRRPRLRVHILAWDYSPVFGADHEWKQEWLFRWKGHRNIRFAFDDKHPVGASHHQKLVIVDGHWAFTGGMDICEARWDLPGHPTAHPLRVDADKKPYHPKHDVQVALQGAPAKELADWYVRQWRAATKAPIADAAVVPKKGRPYEVALEFPPGPVALSLTRGRTLLPPRRAVKQIQTLYERAIARAERLIYIENQYFTSKAVRAALLRRFDDKSKGRLEVAVLLPKERAMMEHYGIVGAESRMIEELAAAAKRTRHRFGVFHPFSSGSGPNRAVWLHSKIMIVDDNFLTVGSANLANRSMGFDTEINASWSATDGSDLAEAIRRLRARLLAEHLGFDVERPGPKLSAPSGMIAALESGGRGGRRVARYARPDLNPIVKKFTSDHTVIDPASPPVEDSVDSLLKDSPNSPFARGISSFLEWVSGERKRNKRAAASAKKPGEPSTSAAGGEK